jgi:DNA anti-recombination protein RmuC
MNDTENVTTPIAKLNEAYQILCARLGDIAFKQSQLSLDISKAEALRADLEISANQIKQQIIQLNEKAKHLRADTADANSASAESSEAALESIKAFKGRVPKLAQKKGVKTHLNASDNVDILNSKV